MDDKLIIPDFVPRKDIEDYQYEVISGTPYRELTTENGFWKGVFEPLEFFNLLYEQHEIVITNIQYLKLIKRHLKSLELENRQRLYLLYNLKYLLNFNADSGKYEGGISISAVCNLIGDEIQSLIEQLFEHYKKDTEYPENRFDYAREIKHINSLADNTTKYSYLQHLLSKYESTECRHWEEKKKWDGVYFRNLMTRERDKYYQLLPENLLSQKPPEIESETDSDKILFNTTKEIIIKNIKSIDKNKGWQYVFNDENDFNLFANILTNFIDGKPYQIPEKTIKLKKNTKTRFAKVLKPIHKDLRDCQMKSDSEFFSIIRILNHFNTDTDTKIYKLINV